MLTLSCVDFFCIDLFVLDRYSRPHYPHPHNKVNTHSRRDSRPLKKILTFCVYHQAMPKMKPSKGRRGGSSIGGSGSGVGSDGLVDLTALSAAFAGDSGGSSEFDADPAKTSTPMVSLWSGKSV